MAHVNQLIDHVNSKLRGVYKEGVWVKALVTQIAFDERDVLMVEGLDIDKYAKEQLEAKIVFRIMPKDQEDMMIHFSGYVDNLNKTGFSEIPKGELALYFKILPAMHWQGEFMPIVKDIGLSDEDAKRANLKTGLRIGIENAILSLPDNNMKAWTESDNQKLEKYYKEDGFGINALAVALKRTPLSIVDQLIRLKLLEGKEAWKIRNQVSGRYSKN
jgi:hypothetical protein